MSFTSNILFGGPDKEKNILRNKLLTYIQQTPSNGEIRWMCYYFNEPTLFNALIEASQRGVNIELILDGNPRTPEINQASLTTLKDYPAIKFTTVNTKPLWKYLGIDWHAHMHSKLYYFSLPKPCVFIGSYNPTADLQYIKQSLIESIGDHSISHNVLVKIEEEKVVACLLQYFNNMKIPNYLHWGRFKAVNNNRQKYKQWDINFLPRYKSHPIHTLLERKDKSASIKCAISHLKGPGIERPLIKAIKNGKNVEVILDSTKRRVSQNKLTYLERHKIKCHQIKTDNHALMHNKFIIYKSDMEHCVLFGSFNWSRRSWWLNHEILACSRNEDIITGFEQRWNEIISTI